MSTPVTTPPTNRATSKRRDNKKLYLGAGLATAALVGGFVTVLCFADHDEKPADAAPTTKKVTSTLEGYLGYEVGKTWFDHPGLNTTIPGDLDGNGKTTKAEKTRVAEAKKTSKAVVDVATTKHGRTTVSSLLTPPGHDWWLFVTSQSDQMRLWHWAAPAEANWFATTWSRESSDRKSRTSYPMVHVAFDDAEQMYAWVNDQDFTSVDARPVYRGTVVSLVPSAVNPDTEKLPAELAKAAKTKVTTGYWSVDFDKQITYDAAESVDADSYQLFWRAAGFGKGASWEAASETPARWAGTLTGWSKDDLNVELAAWALNRTADETSPRLAGAANDVLLSDPGKGVSFGQPAFAPKDAPNDADMFLATTEEFRGQMTRQSAVMGSVTGLASRWVRGNTMVVEQWLGTPPEGESVNATDLPDTKTQLEAPPAKK